jgi:hypothetical protein
LLLVDEEKDDGEVVDRGGRGGNEADVTECLDIDVAAKIAATEFELELELDDEFDFQFVGTGGYAIGL